MTNRLTAMRLAIFDATNLTEDYQAVPVEMDFPCSMLGIINTSDVPIMISYDGIDDHEVIRRYTTWYIRNQINKRGYTKTALWPKNTEVWVKYILGAAKLGSLYIVGYYTEQ